MSLRASAEALSIAGPSDQGGQDDTTQGHAANDGDDGDLLDDDDQWSELMADARWWLTEGEDEEDFRVILGALKPAVRAIL